MKQLLAVLLLAGCALGQTTGTAYLNNLHVCENDADRNCVTFEKPEPMDVPAAEKKVLSHHKGECWGEGIQGLCAGDDIYKSVPTCADKRRVLLTSENGVKHCVLFPRQ